MKAYGNIHFIFALSNVNGKIEEQYSIEKSPANNLLFTIYRKSNNIKQFR
jgi:hypothetical protein